jgi:hypothetical protein
MTLAHDEILQTLRMLQVDNLDIRTTTLGVSLLDCAGGSVEQVAARVYEKLVRAATPLVPGGARGGGRVRHPHRQQAHRGHARGAHRRGLPGGRPRAHRGGHGPRRRTPAASTSSAASRPWCTRAPAARRAT